MRTPFWLKLALRESRSSARRLGVYMGAITLGVAALVAINSFRAQVVESVDTESKALLGADLRLGSNRAFSDTVRAALDSIATTGVPVSYVTTTLSVALAPAGTPRLVQLRGVEGGYPFYGEMVTEPENRWGELNDGRYAFVEPAVLTQMNLAVGDSIRLGTVWFTIRAALTALPPELSFRGAIGPRVYVASQHMPATGLMRFGSLARFEAYLEIPDDLVMQRWIDARADGFRRAGVSFDTAAEQAENLATALESLGRFLGLVGLSALLLGGLGVASAVNVFVKDKRRTVAVLRCLGATQRTAFGAYLLQATTLGTLGAVLGVALGVAIQALLPLVVGDLIPVDVKFAVQWSVVGIGVAIGTLVSATFALLPLLDVRGISPLQALRHDVDDVTARVDPWRILAMLLIVASVVAVAIWQARLWRVGLAYAAALVAGTVILWICSRILIGLTRRIARGGAAAARASGGSARRRSFAVRQGIANLYRPRNQTTSVTMAVGFGVFLVATLWVVQQNLLGWMRTDASRPQANLVLFDIQRDQMSDIAMLLKSGADTTPELVPMVPSRITAVNGMSIDSLLVEVPRRVEGWALRREYRNTYRNTITSAEKMIAGKPFAEADPAPAGVARISIEEDVAHDLDVGIGDRITWDISGMPMESIITSMRTVDWARMQTNFFFVFEPGVLEEAPQTIVSLVTVADDSARGVLQRSVVQGYPNVSVMDIGSITKRLQRIIDRVIYAIRFMAAFSVAAGALVLSGSIAASRFQRVRESALLRAIGATRAQIRNIMLVEYAMLGALAAFTGVALAAVAGWLLMKFVFELEYTLPFVALVMIWVIVTASSAAIGMLNSREALRSTPLAALREAES